MPDHFHGIVVLKPPGDYGDTGDNTVETGYIPSLRLLRLRHNAQNKLQFERYDIQIKSQISLSNIIGTFKAAVTRWCNSNDYEYFGWQRRFHDHIIRNEYDLKRIRKYIRENPLKWEIEQNKKEK